MDELREIPIQPPPHLTVKDRAGSEHEKTSQS